MGIKPGRIITSWRLFYAVLLGGAAAFLIFFFYYPLSSILAGGLTNEQGHLSFGRILTLIGDPYYLKIIGFTLKQAFLSTILAVCLGLPGAYLLARYDFPGKRFVRALTTVPFVLPSIVVVLGFVLFFGNNGLLNRLLMGLFHLEEPPLKILYSLRAILLAHAFYNFPICMRFVSALWSRINPSSEEAARSLGARGARLFVNITLPQIAPAILASAALIFVYCLMSFAIVLVLGGGPRYTTMEVEVYRLAKVSLDLKTGSALALIGSSLSLLSLYFYGSLQRRASFAESLGPNFGLKRLSSTLKKFRGGFYLVYLFLVVLLVLAPILTVLVYSLQSRSGWSGQFYSLDWYRRLLSETWSLRAIGNSLFFAVMTVLLALPLGTLIAYLGRKRLRGGQALDALIMLPIGISSIILGLGYLKAFRNLSWIRSWYAIVAVHTIIAYPFVIRAVSSVLYKIKPTLQEAAASLGANPWQLFFRLELPLIKPAVMSAAAFAFGISMGEINATLMLYNPRLVTMPVAIYRLIGSYNFFGACAMGSLLMAVSFLAFLIIDRTS